MKSKRVEMTGSRRGFNASDDDPPLGVLATIDCWCNIRGIGQRSKGSIHLAQC